MNLLYFMLAHFYDSQYNHTTITSSLVKVLHPLDKGSGHCDVIHKEIRIEWQLYNKLRKLKLVSEIQEGAELKKLKKS